MPSGPSQVAEIRRQGSVRVATVTASGEVRHDKQQDQNEDDDGKGVDPPRQAPSLFAAGIGAQISLLFASSVGS